MTTIQVECPYCNAYLEVETEDEDQGRAEQAAAKRWKGRLQELAQDGKVCPVHKRSKPSRFGGFYCPMPDEGTDNGWCSWRPGKEGAA